jgi:uncharacterized membrane protein YdjX (TVP38/TMEM64 family)
MLIARLDLAANWLGALGQGAIIAYVVLFALTSGLGLLPTYAQALAGGWIFGLEAGTIAALCGFTGGAIVGRIVAGRVAGQGLQGVFEQAPRAAAVRDALLERGPWGTTGVITLLRIPPNSPFALTNLALTACGAAWIPYIIGTAVGMLPRTAVVVGLGAAGAATGAESLLELLESSDRRWMLIGGIVAAIVVLVVLGRISQNAIARVTQPAQQS